MRTLHLSILLIISTIACAACIAPQRQAATLQTPTNVSTTLIPSPVSALPVIPQSSPSPTAASSRYLDAFDTLWANYDRLYPSFPLKGVDWHALRDEYRPHVAAIDSTDALVALLQKMLTPLHDGHIWLINPRGSSLRTYTSNREMNWDRTTALIYQRSNSWKASGSMIYGQIEGFGYITLPGWNDRDFNQADFEAILNSLKDVPALILDLRMNGGGNDGLAEYVAGRFTTESAISEYYQFRSGPGYNDLTPKQARSFGPRGSWQFTKPVVVLIGAGCTSSTESFIAMMQIIPSVTTIGTATGGSSGNPEIFPLLDGWSYSVPRWIASTPDGRIIEGHGLLPDIPVDTSLEDVRNRRDAVLEAALVYLQEHVTR